MNFSINKKDFLIGFLACACIFLIISNIGCGRTLSRLGLGEQALTLPKNFQTMISVSFHREANGDTVKDMTYEATDGSIHSVEYRDKPWHLEGAIRWEKNK